MSKYGDILYVIIFKVARFHATISIYYYGLLFSYRKFHLQDIFPNVLANVYSINCYYIL